MPQYRNMTPEEQARLWSQGRQGMQPQMAPISLADLVMEAGGAFLDEADIAQYALPATLLGLVRYKRPGVSAAARETAEAYHRGPVNDPVALRGAFAQSQARDPIGRPVRVYHGTNQSFETFSPEAMGSERGFFFTDDPTIAGDYARARHRGMGYGRGANIRPSYLDLRNPEIVDMQGKSKYDTFERLISQAQREGRDGVIVRNVDDPVPGAFYDPFGGIPHDVYVAFKPEQIQPAFGRSFLSLRDLVRKKSP